MVSKDNWDLKVYTIVFSLAKMATFCVFVARMFHLTNREYNALNFD